MLILSPKFPLKDFILKVISTALALASKIAIAGAATGKVLTLLSKTFPSVPK